MQALFEFDSAIWISESEVLFSNSEKVDFCFEMSNRCILYPKVRIILNVAISTFLNLWKNLCQILINVLCPDKKKLGSNYETTS